MVGESQFGRAMLSFKSDLEREHWEAVKGLENNLRGDKKSELTVERYTGDVWKFLKWFNKPLKDLKKSDTQAYKEELAKRYSRNSMATIIAGINVFCERILERPELKQRPPKGEIKSTIPLTEEEVGRLLEASRIPADSNWPSAGSNNSDMAKRDYAVICLLYYGGLRRSEVGSLEISDIDFDTNKVRIHSGKGNDWSMINIHENAIAAIKDYLADGRPEPIRPEDHDALFISNEGNRISKNVVWSVVKRAATKAKIKKRIYPHLLRHSLISHMADKGISAPLIQAQSRHHSLDMLQRYIHPSDSVVANAYKQSVTVCVAQPIGVKQSARVEIEPDTLIEQPLSSEERRDKLIDMFIQGKLSESMLQSLLAALGNGSPQENLL